MRVNIRCETSHQIPLDELIPLQGNLKVLDELSYERLKGEILKTGFAFPVYVWATDKKSIIGGHQRVEVLKRLRAEGYEIPPVPVVFIEADDIAQAKRRVLQDVSQYGDISLKGLLDFTMSVEMPPDEVIASFKVPNVDLESWKLLYFDPPADSAVEQWKAMPEYNNVNQKSIRRVIVHFASKEDAAKFFETIGQEDTGITKSVWFPPQERRETELKRYVEE